MNAEIVWLHPETVRAIHNRQIAEHGGSEGIRDEGLLDSALARPQNLLAYGENTDIAALAASYAYGIARNHAFIDGTKRTSLVVSILFLNRNGWDVEAPKEEVYDSFLGLAAGRVAEDELAEWFSAHSAAI